MIFSKSPIQGLWIGQIGLLERLSMASFLANGHPYHLYVYEDQPDVPPGVKLMDAADILPREKIFQYPKQQAKGGYSGFANLFRYCLLERNGGWWCDTDLICLRPFDFKDEIVLASERHWLFWRKLCNNVIYCPPNHELMQRCYREAAAIPSETINFAQNGAPILRRHVRQLGLQRYVRPPDVFNPINWYHSERIIHPREEVHIPVTSYAIHCYRETWRWRLGKAHDKKFRNEVFSEATLLGWLQKKYLPYMHP